MLIVNSTIIEDGAQNSGAVIRCESWPARQSFLMNNIILNKMQLIRLLKCPVMILAI